MELRNYIELGAEKAGNLTALGKMLDMSQPTISSAKAHKRPMPIDAVVKLADYIGADLKTLIAANELVTEKKEEKRAYWRSFVEHVRAASVAGLAVCATLGSAGAEAFQMDAVCIAAKEDRGLKTEDGGLKTEDRALAGARFVICGQSSVVG
jgi:hypothetical protein